MGLEILEKKAKNNVAILQLVGKMDGSNYVQLIDAARRVYQAGSRDLLLDLSQLTYLSSAGLSAMHKTALIFRGEPLPPEEKIGWSAYLAMNRDRLKGLQGHVKLLSPQKEIENLLDISGFKAMFEIYFDQAEAVASY